MKKGLVALLTAMSLMVSQISFAVVTSQAEGTAKQMEYLDRGTVAVVVDNGVYISWRLLGSESLSNQAFDIYRDGTKIHTTGVHDATCYTDTNGTASNKYAVVPAGTSVNGEKTVSPWTTNVTNTANVPNSIAHKDLTFEAPASGKTPGDEEYTYSVNDMSVGDLDGDGEYELVVKWDPSNSKDNSQTGYTGEVYIDAYELDGTRLWRMNLGPNIRAGAHYTQFMVYDFDGDGRAEVAFKTAPGSKDGTGRYVSRVGKDIGQVNDSADYRSDAGTILDGPEYLTIFYGETGEAMQTILYDPPRNINTSKEWGDNYGNRCERYLAGVAYLDGKTPSLIMVRGYYTYAYVAAYTWDGEHLSQQWLSSNYPDSHTVRYANGSTKTTNGKTLYGQGAHSLSVADVDNDNYDEIVFGSAILDHDGTVLLYDGRGHGDAEHVSDFDNDGQQEIFMVHEAGKGNSNVIDFAVDVKRYNGDVVLQAATGDVGRGVMGNVDDAYAQQSGDLSLFWSVASENAFNQKGESVGYKPNAANFLIYWDGDLSREILDENKLSKYTVAGGTGRFYYDKKTSWLSGASSNNGSKATPGLVADILGDWREEMIFTNGSGARIFFSTIPTEYRLTTLMHDGQYRCAVAWQNVEYNQPPHQSYYIGSAALAKSGSTTLNYLAPATGFDEIEYPDVSGVTPRPTLEPTPTPQIVSVTATKSRNEIGTASTNDTSDRVWINYFNNTWGAAYFGFTGIEDFDPALVESAVIKFTPISYNTTNRNRQFFFDLFGTDDNSWETGVVTVSADPYPNDATKISSTECYTNNGNGDVLVPGSVASFDVTSYVKSLAKGTTDMSFIVAIPSGSGGVGACELLMYNNPTLEMEVSKPEPTATPTPTPTPIVVPTPTSAVPSTPAPTPENTQTFDEAVAVVEASGVTTWDTGSLDGWFLHRNDANGTVQVADGRINVRVVSNNKTYLGLHADTVANSANKFVTFGFDYETSSVSTNNNQCTEIAVFSTDIDDVTWNTWNGNGAVLKTCNTGMTVNTVYHVEFTIDNIEHTINYRITDSTGNIIEEKSLTNEGSGDINTIVFRTGKGVTDYIDNFYYSVGSPVVATPTPTPSPTPTPTPSPTPTPTIAPTPTVPIPIPDRAIFTTYDATEITSDSAMLNGYCEIIRGNGVLNVDFAGIFYYWEKGNSEEINSTPYSGFLYSSSSVSYPISGLKPSTTYVYRLNDGNEVEFTTLATSSLTPSPTPTIAPTLAPTVTPTTAPTAEPTTAPTPTPDVDTTPHPIVVDNLRYNADSNVAEIVSVEERVGTVIFASFDDNGNLVSISVKADYEIPFAYSTVAPDENFVPTDDVRVYVWDSLKTMKPLFTAAK